ncbi:MAG: 2-hydroxyacyl-CoA dehydratase family protein, partial [Deltaproteobacteria bacterium]|nr:2-hydroxyacyl-CoA dehydratase family protein [Deltaproteobacteria bacterium]
ERLRADRDYRPEFDYFLHLLAEGLAVVESRAGRPVMSTMCLQAPLELFRAHGIQPIRIFGGHFAAAQLAAPLTPATSCSMIRSTLGSLLSIKGGRSGVLGLVIPTTCHWVAKFPALLSLADIELGSVLVLESPRGRFGATSQKKWLAEIYRLNSFLAQQTGLKLTSKGLLASISAYREANRVFSRLIELKRNGLLSQIWFSVIAGSFGGDDVESWTRAVSVVLASISPEKVSRIGPIVCLTGSPVFFPNFKIFRLIEEAGLNLVKDDLCSGERALTGPVHYRDPSIAGLIKALAQRYHEGCQCPVFFDNGPRLENIVLAAQKNLFQGLIFHVLKGCHQFDLESLALEKTLKEKGLKVLRLETDGSPEDSGSLLTRLEAFRSVLSS